MRWRTSSGCVLTIFVALVLPMLSTDITHFCKDVSCFCFCFFPRFTAVITTSEGNILKSPVLFFTAVWECLGPPVLSRRRRRQHIHLHTPCACTGTPPCTNTCRGRRWGRRMHFRAQPGSGLARLRATGPVSSRVTSPLGPALLLTADAVFCFFSSSFLLFSVTLVQMQCGRRAVATFDLTDSGLVLTFWS